MKLSTIAELSIVALLTLTGCNSQNQNEIQTELDTAIINGIKVRDTNKLAKSIVRIKGQMNCTGSLISSDIVITAAHCVYGESTVEIIFDHNSNEDDSYIGRVLVHDNYGSDIEFLKQSDLALIKLNKVAPRNYEPIPILKDSSKVSNNTVIHIYGYGVSKVQTNKIDSRDYTTSAMDELIKLDVFQCNEDRTDCVENVFEHTGELFRGIAKRDKSTEKGFLTSYETFKFNTCFVDSGGPAFVKIEGQYYLYGVISAGDSLCQSYSLYVDVTKHIDWILDSIEKLNKDTGYKITQ